MNLRIMIDDKYLILLKKKHFELTDSIVSIFNDEYL